MADWISIFGSVEGQVIAGVKPVSALVRGAGVSVIFEGGFANRVFRNEQSGTQIGVNIKMRGKHGRNLIPYTLVEALVGETQESIDDIVEDDLLEILLSKEDSLVFGASLNGAQALGKYFGLQVGIEGLLGGANYHASYVDEEVRIDTTRQVVSFGTTFTGSAAPYFPIGVLLEYRFRRIFEQVDNAEVAELNTSRHRLGFGLHYTGREDLMLGLFFSTRLWRGEQEPEKYYYGQIVMEYFF